jgi:hypothetical protein
MPLLSNDARAQKRFPMNKLFWGRIVELESETYLNN